MSVKQMIAVVVVAIGVFFGIPVLWGSFYTVDSGEKAIVKTWGAVSDVVGDGMHFKVPFAQSVTKVDVRTKKAHSPAGAGSKDQQKVATEVSVNYHLNSEKLKEIYTKTGLDVDERLIDPRIQEVVKAVVARYTAEQLLSMRESIRNEIEVALKESLSPYNIVVEAVQITNFDFSEQYNAAIEAKQVAEQNALKAKNDLERIKIEAEQKIALAEAEAQTIRIQSEAVRAQGGKEYVSLKAIEKWDGSLPTYMGGNSPMPFLNLK